MTDKWHCGLDLKTRTVIVVYVRGCTTHTRDDILRDYDNACVSQSHTPRTGSGAPL